MWGPNGDISLYVDYHLSPLVRKLPSYIKDTNDFLTKIQALGDLPPESLLVTLDVTSLDTNIPHQEGLNACREILDTRTALDPPNDDLIHLASLILDKNNFSFDNHHYLRIQGTAMGTRMASSYTNIFMAKLETEVLQSVSKRLMVWWRYTDDVFAIWPHGEESLQVFLKQTKPISYYHQICGRMVLEIHYLS